MQHRQESNDGVHKQDADMNKDDKEQDPTEEKSNVTVSKTRETQDDEDRDSKRQRLSSVATHHSKPQHAGVLKYWDHVNGGELCARGVQKARQLEVEYPNKMSVRGRSAVLARQAQDWTKPHGLNMRDTRAAQRS